MTLSPRLTAPLAGLVLVGVLAACTDPGVGAPGSADPAESAAAATCPTSQPAALPAGELRDVTVTTDLGTFVMTIEADLSPIAAGNLVALAECGYYDGVVFHRIVPDFVIQGGDPTGTGTGGPGYTIEDEPVTAEYGRGVVAMARTSQPNSVGSQFFVVLDDEGGPILQSYNTYQIIGSVTSGMETVDAIEAAAEGVELPPDPVVMTDVSVSTP
jgi:cyclophilin family peptidyl-prolyl cis-trans isomerase